MAFDFYLERYFLDWNSVHILLILVLYCTLHVLCLAEYALAGACKQHLHEEFASYIQASSLYLMQKKKVCVRERVETSVKKQEGVSSSRGPPLLLQALLSLLYFVHSALVSHHHPGRRKKKKVFSSVLPCFPKSFQNNNSKKNKKTTMDAFSYFSLSLSYSKYIVLQ